LEHDADLDISQICAMHAVYETPEDGVHWLHTHGLGEIGYFDFDVLFPSEEVLFDGGDVMRAIAFAIAEGEVKSDTPRFQVANPRGNIAFCPSDRFQREAAAEVAALRTVDDYHSSRRSVICEPVGGLLSRFHKAPRFSRFLSEKLPPNPVIRYSAAATELMADRAAKTYQLFCRIYDDLSDIALPTLVKLGYPVDNGDDGENEHLWFQVESLNDRGIDAILLNSPYQIAGMKEGDRKIHSMELLTDWTIISPLGNITPRSLHNFRAIEPAREALKAMFSNRGQ
jgi:hypothetical protein